MFGVEHRGTHSGLHEKGRRSTSCGGHSSTKKTVYPQRQKVELKSLKPEDVLVPLELGSGFQFATAVVIAPGQFTRRSISSTRFGQSPLPQEPIQSPSKNTTREASQLGHQNCSQRDGPRQHHSIQRTSPSQRAHLNASGWNHDRHPGSHPEDIVSYTDTPTSHTRPVIQRRPFLDAASLASRRSTSEDHHRETVKTLHKSPRESHAQSHTEAPMLPVTNEFGQTPDAVNTGEKQAGESFHESRPRGYGTPRSRNQSCTSDLQFSFSKSYRACVKEDLNPDGAPLKEAVSHPLSRSQSHNS